MTHVKNVDFLNPNKMPFCFEMAFFLKVTCLFRDLRSSQISHLRCRIVIIDSILGFMKDSLEQITVIWIVFRDEL